MKKIVGRSTVLLAMGLVSLACFILARLAMTDIFHGEPDLDLEWLIVSVTFLPILAFHGFALWFAAASLRRPDRA
jgi:hypothetical protein